MKLQDFLNKDFEVNMITYRKEKMIIKAKDPSTALADAMREHGIKNKDFIERAEIIRDAGTSKSKFLRGEINQYTWVDIGSSYLPSELSAAYLYAQLEEAETIIQNRLDTWNIYYNGLKPLQEKGLLK